MSMLAKDEWWYLRLGDGLPEVVPLSFVVVSLAWFGMQPPFLLMIHLDCDVSFGNWLVIVVLLKLSSSH